AKPRLKTHRGSPVERSKHCDNMTVYRFEVFAAGAGKTLQMQVTGIFQEKSSLAGISIQNARYRQSFRMQVVPDQQIGVVLIGRVFFHTGRNQADQRRRSAENSKKSSVRSIAQQGHDTTLLVGA